MSEHGTKAAYETHKRRGEKPCDLCRRAQTIYQREWRGRNPDRQAALQVKSARRLRALTILGRRHQGELLRIIEELRQADETPPV